MTCICRENLRLKRRDVRGWSRSCPSPRAEPATSSSCSPNRPGVPEDHPGSGQTKKSFVLRPRITTMPPVSVALANTFCRNTVDCVGSFRVLIFADDIYFVIAKGTLFLFSLPPMLIGGLHILPFLRNHEPQCL